MSVWTELGPLLSIGLAAVAVMVAIAIHRSHKLSLGITLAGLGIAIWRLWPAAAASMPDPQITSLLRMDGFALFFIGLAAAAAFVVALLAYNYLEQQDTAPEEFYVLLLVATLGTGVLAASDHFATFFLGLELLSVSLYGLSAYPHRRPLPLEAGIKYLILASSSAAFLLFGMALIYFAAGSMNFQDLAGLLPSAPTSFILPGAVLIFVGIGYKLSLVPFHLWAPDVYQGVPAPVTAFIATASKAGIFAVLLRLYYALGSPHDARATWLIAAVAIASMVVGNLLALRQGNLKRLLAYSSIAHMGYILVAFLAVAASAATAAAAVGFYFLAYFITTLGAFGVISALTAGESEPESIEDYRGLFWRRPWLALTLVAMLLSLAGIPLTAGFLAKFYVVAAGAAATLWLLLLVLVFTSVVGLFYYLRVVVAIFDSTDVPATAALRPIPRMGGWVLGALFVMLIYVGVYPQPFLHLVLNLPLR